MTPCPDCGARVWPTALRVPAEPGIPDYTTVTWNCRTCGWLSRPDAFVSPVEEEEPAAAERPTAAAEQAPAAEWLPPDEAEPHPDAAVLTARERAVLELIAAGLANQEIGDRLLLSVNTVKTYTKKVYRKLGVHSRAQAVVWARRHGFVDPHRPHR